MKQYDMQFLVNMIQKTYEVDESGDAHLTGYSEELIQQTGGFDGSISVHDYFVNFLVWANGPDWVSWLPDAQPGQIPPTD